MWHPLIDVISYRYLEDYRVWVKFEDGVEQTIDFAPVLEGELFGPLRDLELFRQVSLNQEIGTLVWPNGADFDPWTLHEWPAVVQELSARARAWALVPTP